MGRGPNIRVVFLPDGSGACVEAATDGGAWRSGATLLGRWCNRHDLSLPSLQPADHDRVAHGIALLSSIRVSIFTPETRNRSRARAPEAGRQLLRGDDGPRP